MLNELEFIEGKIWANVYTSTEVIIIDSKSFKVSHIFSHVNSCLGPHPTNRTQRNLSSTRRKKRFPDVKKSQPVLEWGKKCYWETSAQLFSVCWISGLGLTFGRGTIFVLENQGVAFLCVHTQRSMHEFFFYSEKSLIQTKRLFVMHLWAVLPNLHLGWQV